MWTFLGQIAAIVAYGLSSLRIFTPLPGQPGLPD